MTATGQSMASSILRWMNRDRVALGLRAYRSWTALSRIATDRAARMAAKHTLSHTVAGGDVGNVLTNAGIQWYSYGEVIGMSGYAWGSQAASNLYTMWKGSSHHRAILFSTHLNYAGVGIIRASDGTTWASIVFSESVDHTIPRASNGSLTATGTSLAFNWSGIDPTLQTHTAGLRSFDVQYRVDGGTWALVRDNTTTTALYLSGRAHGHYYSFRVQSADKRGNLSLWTAEKRIWVP